MIEVRIDVVEADLAAVIENIVVVVILLLGTFDKKNFEFNSKRIKNVKSANKFIF